MLSDYGAGITRGVSAVWHAWDLKRSRTVAGVNIRRIALLPTSVVTVAVVAAPAVLSVAELSLSSGLPLVADLKTRRHTGV